jgi:xanthine dehydrogenase YagR molybdenum-binding subunit
MDPLELRRKNYSTKSAGNTGNPYGSKGLDKCYDAGEEKIAWRFTRRKKPGEGTGMKRRGVGMASQIWWGGGAPGTKAIVRIHSDGGVDVLCGTQDIGTGTKTVLAQVVAEELGIQFKDVRVKIGDTELPWAPGSGGSNTAPSVCPAARAAAADAKAKLFGLAMTMLKAKSEEEVESKNGKIFVKNDPSRSASWKEVTAKINDMIVGNGERAPHPKGIAHNAFGAHFAEVEVDMITGRVKVLRVVAAHEFGRCVNPLTAENQIVGGVTQGVSFTLFESRVMDDKIGKMVNTNMRDYRIIPAPDVPQIEPIIIDMVDIDNDIGMKGLGEPPRIPTAAAIANAIYNATGARIRELPITPDKVLAALAERGS